MCGTRHTTATCLGGGVCVPCTVHTYRTHETECSICTARYWQFLPITPLRRTHDCRGTTSERAPATTQGTGRHWLRTLAGCTSEWVCVACIGPATQEQRRHSYGFSHAGHATMTMQVQSISSVFSVFSLYFVLCTLYSVRSTQIDRVRGIIVSPPSSSWPSTREAQAREQWVPTSTYKYLPDTEPACSQYSAVLILGNTTVQSQCRHSAAAHCSTDTRQYYGVQQDTTEYTAVPVPRTRTLPFYHQDPKVSLTPSHRRTGCSPIRNSPTLPLSHSSANPPTPTLSHSLPSHSHYAPRTCSAPHPPLRTCSTAQPRPAHTLPHPPTPTPTPTTVPALLRT